MLSLKLTNKLTEQFSARETVFDIARHHYALPDIDCAGGIVGKKECVVSIVQICRRNKRSFLS